MTTLAPSFLICSSLFLQVTRTTITSRLGLKFGRIRPGTYELAALERLVLGWIFFILADNKTNHKSSDEFEFQQDSITDFGVSCP